MQSLSCQIPMRPAELESVQTEVSRLGTCLEAMRRQCFPAQEVVIAMEAKCDQNCTLIDAESQNSQDFKELLVKVGLRLDDHSSQFHFSQDLLRYEINRALHDSLQPMVETVRQRTVAIPSASKSQVETRGKKLRLSASCIYTP